MEEMRIRKFASCVGLCCLFVLAAKASLRAQTVPHYKVDGSWPKTLPNNWILTNMTGLFVDKNDHIWVLNRPRMTSADDSAAAQTPPIGECWSTSPIDSTFGSGRPRCGPSITAAGSSRR